MNIKKITLIVKFGFLFGRNKKYCDNPFDYHSILPVMQSLPKTGIKANCRRDRIFRALVYTGIAPDTLCGQNPLVVVFILQQFDIHGAYFLHRYRSQYTWQESTFTLSKAKSEVNFLKYGNRADIFAKSPVVF